MHYPRLKARFNIDFKDYLDWVPTGDVELALRLHHLNIIHDHSVSHAQQ